MRIIHGNLRTVIALPFLGIVIKLPTRPTLNGFLSLLKSTVKRGFLQRAFQQQTEELTYPMITATMANRREYKFFRETRFPILEPTLFSLFGLINIQRLEISLKREAGDAIWGTLWSLATDKAEGQHLVSGYASSH